MLTLMVCVLLAYSFYHNRRHRIKMTATDHVLYYAIALISLALAAARDLDVDLPMPAVLMKKGLDNLGDIMQKG